jgi:hypothetical protein
MNCKVLEHQIVRHSLTYVYFVYVGLQHRRRLKSKATTSRRTPNYFRRSPCTVRTSRR